MNGGQALVLMVLAGYLGFIVGRTAAEDHARHVRLLQELDELRARLGPEPKPGGAA